MFKLGLLDTDCGLTEALKNSKSNPSGAGGSKVYLSKKFISKRVVRFLPLCPYIESIVAFK